MTRLLALSLALLPVAACAAENGDEGLYIDKVLAPTEDCTFTSAETEAFQARGFYTANEFQHYRAVLQIVSRLTANAAQVEARTVQMRGARVSLRRSDGESISGVDDEFVRFTSLGAGPVKPNGGRTDTAFDVIPLEFGLGAGPGEYLATIEVYGDMAGDEITSQEYVFPIVISGGFSVGTCPLPAGTVVTSGGGCGFYQDAPTTCCEMGGELICPAIVAEPTPP